MEEKMFSKAKLPREKKNELTFQETDSWNNTSQVDFLDSNSTNYNKSNLAYLQLHKTILKVKVNYLLYNISQ